MNWTVFPFWINFKAFNSFTYNSTKIKINLVQHQDQDQDRVSFDIWIYNSNERLTNELTRIFSSNWDPIQSGCKACGGSKEQQNWKRLFSLDNKLPRRFEIETKKGLCLNKISRPLNKISTKLYLEIKINYKFEEEWERRRRGRDQWK